MDEDKHENIIELCMMKQCRVPEGDHRYEKSLKAANAAYDLCRKNYDKSRGKTFAQYATYGITMAIRSACKPRDRVIGGISLTMLIETAKDPSIMNSPNAIYAYLKKELKNRETRITKNHLNSLQIFIREYCMNDNISLNVEIGDENGCSERQDFLSASLIEQPEIRFDIKETGDIAADTIYSLEGRDREIAMLSFYKGKTIREISDITGYNENNVRNWIYSGLDSIYMKIVFNYYTRRKMIHEAVDLFNDSNDRRIVELWFKYRMGFSDIGSNLGITNVEMIFRVIGRLPKLPETAWLSAEEAVTDISNISGIDKDLIKSRLPLWLFDNTNGICLKEMKPYFRQRNILRQLQLAAIHDNEAVMLN